MRPRVAPRFRNRSAHASVASVPPLRVGLAGRLLPGCPAVLAGQPPPSPEAVELVRLVVRTATRSERLLSDVPIRTEVLRGEDIALRAATDFSRVAELVNGLRVESNCQTCNTTEVQLLGLGGAYNQLLFDGVQIGRASW